MKKIILPPDDEGDAPSDDEFRYPPYFRVPRSGARDKIFGMSRSFYYQLEQNGSSVFHRLRRKGNKRGVTLVSTARMREYILGNV